VTQRAIHQILVGAGPGDAITAMARHIRSGLRALGPSEIYAHFVSPGVAGDVLPLSSLSRPGRNDLLVYHASYGVPLITQVLLARPEPIVLVYHNITPSEHYVRHDPAFAAGLVWGRHELGLLHDRVRLAIAVSSFNAADLAAQGYSDVHILPAGLHPRRLHATAPSGALAPRLRDRFPHGFALTVSQLLPHKRMETIIQAMHLLQWVHERPLGLAVVGTPRSQQYADALLLYAQQLNVERVWFFGSASDAELSTMFRCADLFVSASAHEGLALPPLEAMSFGVPVIARDAGALAETLGGAGLLLPQDSGCALMAEAMVKVLDDPELRATLRRRGEARVAQIEADDPVEGFVALVGRVV
jgi:glycosyltransferase involved in cell wall biosynthesis